MTGFILLGRIYGVAYQREEYDGVSCLFTVYITLRYTV